MRVALLSLHTCPMATLGGKKTGGMNVYVRELSHELAKRGIQVDIFTRLQDSCASHLDQQPPIEGLRLVHIQAGAPDITSTAQMSEYVDEFTEGVLAYATEHAATYDVIHSHYWLSGQAARQLSCAWNVPFLQMFHTLGHMKNRIALGPEEMEPEIRLTVEYQVMADADLLIAATPAEKIQLMWLYQADMHKIRVIPPGVDTGTFHPIPKIEARRVINATMDDKLLVFVGRNERLKGLDTLLQAMALVRDGQPKVDHLHLYAISGFSEDNGAEDEEFERLLARREELGLEGLVTFLGARSQQTLQYYYAAAEAVIMPSHYESFGMVALEAMACGTPVIASEVGGLAYLIQDGVTGFHVPDQEPDELAGKIRLILENDDLRLEMSGAAVRSAQRYTWPLVTDQIMAAYREVILKKQTPSK